MTFYVLFLAVVLNGQYMTAFHSEDRKTPHLFKSKAECEKARAESDAVLGPEIKEAGGAYELKCITSEEASKILGKEGV